MRLLSSKWLPALIITATLTIPAIGQDASSGLLRAIEDLRDNSLTSEEIRSTDWLESVVIVDLGEIDGEGSETLQAILGEIEDGFAQVQTAIDANEPFEEAIAQASLPLRDVIAVTRNEDGVTTIYVR